MADHPFEPYRIKVTEPIFLSSRDQREAWLAKAHLNLFGLDAQQVMIDLLTDSGTSAMSQHQWAGIMEGDESYAGAVSFQHVRDAVRKVTGYRHVVPTHQGRSAEFLLFNVLAEPGDLIPNNTHFDTTAANVKLRGATPVNLPCEAASSPDESHPFKGDMDVRALRRFLKENAGRVPLVMTTVTNNSAGGQPVSMKNLRAVSRVCREFEKPLIIDGCRYAENAWFIQRRERGYAHKSIPAIAREMFALADGMTMSAKKDALVNIGGFFATRREPIARKIRELMVAVEGFPTYGGMAGRDMEALARGLFEGLDERYLTARIEQVAYLADRLTAGGVPILTPPGGHAVFVNAARFCDHVPRERFPGQALCVALYLESGIRAVEIGTVMLAETDPETGEVTYPKMEMVRLAIPRRVYTRSHVDYVADSLIALYGRRKAIRGLRFTYEPPRLRHFLGRYEWC